MSKMLAVLAAIVMLWMIALPRPANATRRWENGIRDGDQIQRRCVRMAPHTYRPYCYFYRPNYHQTYHFGFYWRWY